MLLKYIIEFLFLHLKWGCVHVYLGEHMSISDAVWTHGTQNSTKKTHKHTHPKNAKEKN